ncbi:MAG: stage 0 sporulation family protein [Coriobacteriia bacterium]|nr:stage 0 sporulation family protein [Coriobacteriia bacterium]
MPTVVGVKLRFAPKVLFFDSAGTEPMPGQAIVVQTERGTEMGQVVDVPCEIEDAHLPAPLKPVERIATDEDLALAAELAEKEREAMRVYRQLIEENHLDMKPVDVEYLFGGDKVIFYFVAEERVDFRELVRELASRFKVRIDMRQVGVRDEARMVGGLGHCGQQLCCVRFAGDFQPVSIRMAKEQDLPLNPLKISGLCGRLMCCLRYEYEAYKDFKSRAPKRGAKVETPVGEGKVASLNTPRETVHIRLAEGGSLTVPLESVECPGGGCPCRISAETIEALAGPAASSALTGSLPELRESKPESASSGAGEGSGGGGGKRRPRRKSKGKQPASGQQQAGSGSEGAATVTTQGEQPPAEGGSQGRRRRRRRSSPNKGDNAKG